MVHVTKKVMLELKGESGDGRAGLTQGPLDCRALRLAALCSSGFQSFNCAAGSGSGLCALAQACSQPDNVNPVASLDVCKFTEASY